MKPPKLYATALRRYNRSRGFGIHSPFAYSFVTGTLGERAHYYAYEQINQARACALQLASGAGARHPRVISAKNAKMLFRVVCRFHPTAIFQIGAHYGVSTLAALLCDSHTTLSLHAPANPHADIFSHITRPVATRIIPAPDFTQALQDYLSEVGPCGLRFFMVSDLRGVTDVAALTAGLCQLVREGRTVVVLRNLTLSASGCSHLWHSLCAALPHGMSFTNGNIAFVTALSHLPVQHFTLWF